MRLQTRAARRILEDLDTLTYLMERGYLQRSYHAGSDACSRD